MGRKELVLINLAPASSPCLLTGLSLSFSHLAVLLLCKWSSCCRAQKL